MSQFHKKMFPVRFDVQASDVDAVGGVIKNVAIINAGLNKNGDNIDDIFLRQITEQGNAQSQGVKARFGHPNMCKEALGTYVGRYKNFSMDATSVRADLHLDPLAKNTPNGNLYDYVVSMAAKNDDMFGNSIVFKPAEEYEYKMEEDADGKPIHKKYIRLESFIASDLVDSPAATNSLFRSTDADMAANLTTYLDENPEVFEVIKSKPEVVNQFFDKYATYLSMKNGNNKASEPAWLTAIKNSFSALTHQLNGTEPAPEEVTLDVDLPLANGGTLSVATEGEPAVGDGVSVNGAPAEPGDFLLADGRTVVVGEGSTISEIKPAAESTNPPSENQNSDDAAELDRLRAQVTALTASRDLAEVNNRMLETALRQLGEEATKLKNSIGSNYVPKDRDNVKPPLKTEKNKMEQAAEREKKYTDNKK